mgnify:FL=1
MKFLKVFFVLIVLSFLFFTPKAEAVCLRMYGMVSLLPGSSWPPGGTVTLQCLGDVNPGPPNWCVGNGPISVAPGEVFDFPSCSCLTSECLKVSSLPPGCTSLGLNSCGQNGITISPNVQIYCPPPPAACGTDCRSDSSICTTASGGCTTCSAGTGTCQPPSNGPGCGTSCAGNPSICQLATDGCTSCNTSTGACQQPTTVTCGTPCSLNPGICATASGGCTSCNTSTGTCQPPSGPTCGTNCAGNPSICQTASGGCTSCNTSTGTCQPTTTACGTSCAGNPSICQTATGGCTSCNTSTGAQNGCTACTNGSCQPPTSVACNTPCTTQSQCAGAQNNCTACTNGTCQAAPFSDAMCKCDNLTYNPRTITPGGNLQVTAFGRVEGVNTNYAQISQFTFNLYRRPIGGSDTNHTPIGQSVVTSTQIVNTPTLARYQAIWNLVIPADRTQEYRIQSVPKCVRKTAQATEEPKILVLSPIEGSEDTIIGKVTGFINKLLGQSSYLVVPVYAQQQNLQLKTFIPAGTVATDNCSFIKFSFPSQ